MNGHADVVSERNCVMSATLQSDVKIIIHKDEIFVYYKYHKDSQWFAIVQKVGYTTLKFRSVFVISSPRNKIESINMIFPVTDTEESIDNILEEGRSMVLDDTVVDRFVEDGELCMMVAVEEVT
jgi:hypothetical protein